MQFNESAEGMTPLPKPSVDTGMGLERLTAILQGEINNYHTDLFQDLIAKASDLCRIEYVRDTKKLRPADALAVDQTNVALRVLADHARAAAFLIGDGVLPSNEGRGYVLRRIMRRAIRYGRKLSIDQSLYPVVVGAVIDKMKSVFPELGTQARLITSTVKDEEERFLTTLDQGTHILNEELRKLEGRGQKVVSGEVAFKLYDTYGFPLDLTRLMTTEQGMNVDEAGFEKNMSAARERAKASWKGSALSGNAAHLVQWTQELSNKNGATEFLGYDEIETRDVPLLALSNGAAAVEQLKAGESGILTFARTPFYAESGGQAGDTGVIVSASGQAEVVDCNKQNGVHLHHVRVTDGVLSLTQPCFLKVLDSGRRRTASNHSATHLLHSALRQVLGTHVTQAGSLVEADRLRFDFTHNKPLSAQELREIEELVNEQISRSSDISIRQMPIKAALAEGALAMFGEKYGEEVRVIRMGDFSTELCGGTHVSNTAMIRLFKVVSESGVSSGVRRIEALTGDMATRFALANTWENLEARARIGLNQNWSQYLDSSAETLPASGVSRASVSEWIDTTRAEVKNLERQIQSLKGQSLDLEALLKSAEKITAKPGQWICASVEVDDRAVLSEIADKLRDRLGSSALVLVGKGESSHPIVVSISKDLTGIFNAGGILKEVAVLLGGKGGGRPDFAQGAVPKRDLTDVLPALKKYFLTGAW